MSTQLLTREQAATFLQFSVKTLANWAVTGAGPRLVKIGGRVRYRQADLDKWIEKNTVGSKK